jgi:hypothetical protein
MTLEERQLAASRDTRRSSFSVVVSNPEPKAPRPPQADECRCPACLGIPPQRWARRTHADGKNEPAMTPAPG